MVVFIGLGDKIDRPVGTIDECPFTGGLYRASNGATDSQAIRSSITTIIGTAYQPSD
jgi:hypothetical protein